MVRALQGYTPRGMIFLRGIEGYVNCEAGVENNTLQLQRDL
jgi:PII-like signaling protein